MPVSQIAQKYASDELLIAGLRNGDKDALGFLFTKFYDRVINSLKFKFSSIDLMDIDACYTDSCIDLFKQLQTGRHSEIILYNLLYTISIRKVIALVREQVKIGVLKNFNSSEEDSRFLPDNEYTDDEYFLPELDEGWEEKERELKALENAMEEMKENENNCYENLKLKYIDGLKYDEIAKLRNINEDSARKNMKRCKEKLINKYNIVLSENRELF